MKKIHLTVLAVAFLLVGIAATVWVYKPAVLEQADVSDQQTDFTEPSERFVGNINGAEIMFEQKDYTAYRMTIDGKVSHGLLNTERGYDDDIDATLYILNWKEPESQQMYVVRLTSDYMHLQMLDSNRKIIPGAMLVREL